MRQIEKFDYGTKDPKFCVLFEVPRNNKLIKCILIADSERSRDVWFHAIRTGKQMKKRDYTGNPFEYQYEEPAEGEEPEESPIEEEE